MLTDRPGGLEEWSRQVGAALEDGLREAPSWTAFARQNGTVYRTYTVTAPDPFVAPYYKSLLERTPKPPPEEPRACERTSTPADAEDRYGAKRGNPPEVAGPSGLTSGCGGPGMHGAPPRPTCAGGASRLSRSALLLTMNGAVKSRN